MIRSVQEMSLALEQVGYLADPGLASTLALTEQLARPLLLEGEAGVGKTEVARAMAAVKGCKLIRLQCYEGLDVRAAVYEWNYQLQLLAIKIVEVSSQAQPQVKQAELTEQTIFSDRFLLRRPLLEAISQSTPPVLLIDEIDRADEEFEAYLLEMLSDFQISIPELGTIRAVTIPLVVLTSNGTRELSDALRRRCLYHYVEYPSRERELQIVLRRLPDVGHLLAGQIVAFVQSLRNLDLRKKPGIAETLDWAAALVGFKTQRLQDDPERVLETLTCLLKTRQDCLEVTADVVERLIAQAA